MYDDATGLSFPNFGNVTMIVFTMSYTHTYPLYPYNHYGEQNNLNIHERSSMDFRFNNLIFGDMINVLFNCQRYKYCDFSLVPSLAEYSPLYSYVWLIAVEHRIIHASWFLWHVWHIPRFIL